MGNKQTGKIENPIAFRKLKAVDPEGKVFELEIKIGQPYEVDEHEWQCPLDVGSLDRKINHASGVDSLQALLLALMLVKISLEVFLKKGGKIYWFDDMKPISLDILGLNL